MKTLEDLSPTRGHHMTTILAKDTVTRKISFSVNRQGRNKDWNKEVLTTGFKDQKSTISDLKKAVKAGFAISGAHFNGKRKRTVSVDRVGLLLVDVDNGMTMEEAKADPFICQYCCLAYTTASHQPASHRFRLIFALPSPIDRESFEVLVREFLSRFDSHDPSCKDAGRAFYGNTDAEFFIENYDAVLPQEWINAAIAKAKHEKTEAERKRQERIEWLKNNPLVGGSAIPLINCCRTGVRDLIDDGVPEGSGHNDAALSVAMELIAVERFLREAGKQFAGSARDYYDQFLITSGVSGYKAEQRWEWAESRRNLDPSLDLEIIQHNIHAYNFRQLTTKEERDQYRKDHPDFEPINTHRDISQNPKVIPIKRKAQTSVDKVETVVSIQDRLLKLALEHLPPKDLEAEIANIANEYGQTTQAVWRIYQATVNEIEADESRASTQQELSQLLSSQSDSIGLDRILPLKLAGPIVKFMKWLNLRPESAATALITGLSSVLHPKTRIVLNSNLGWSESPGFNGGIVANSTQKKSPIMNTFMIRPLTKLQVWENERHKEALSDYQAQMAEYEKLSKSKRDQDRLKEEYPDGPPQEPKKTVWFYTNTTIEKLKSQMAEQPDKGILLGVDELASLFGNMNAYRGGKGSDRQDLLSMKDGSPISVGRKNGDVFVESPSLSIFGTIQPKVLQKILGDGNDSDGFFARFCFVRQPLAATTLPELTDENFDISPMIEGLYRQVASLPATTYRLSSAAYSALKITVDAYEQKRVSAGDHPIGNVYGKSGGRIGELSMLLHVIKHCFEGQIPPEVIEAETVKSAIELVTFYTNQSLAIYAELDNQPSSIAPHLLKIINLAKSKGTLTPRLVGQFIRDLKSAKDRIPSYFDELEKMGLGIVHRERTIKFTLTSDSPTSFEASVDKCRQTVDKVETTVYTSKSLQDKDFNKVETSVDKKNEFSDFLSQDTEATTDKKKLVGDQTTDKEVSPFVSTSSSNLDTASDQGVYTLSTLPSTLPENVYTSVYTSQTIEWNDLISRNDSQIERLEFSQEDAQNLLKERYGVKSRQKLTDDQILDWIGYCDELISQKLVGGSEEVA